ncbi:uncharacterized protein CLUP02_15276 [Colletotrichum lupini]|uniref:Uncharacterized protein n=1 Tax=Colletotrichum lupini TaxID=145971 RepID=A0A9Q8T671_9PEZI|nr:uncharacterized protein CLUP02_15276 [Colletotrichum lupini]UQC89745.1 hypothetical protein CLUP02_15276 [Colletotrichum lupini]
MGKNSEDQEGETGKGKPKVKLKGDREKFSVARAFSSFLKDGPEPEESRLEGETPPPFAPLGGFGPAGIGWMLALVSAVNTRAAEYRIKELARVQPDQSADAGWERNPQWYSIHYGIQRREIGKIARWRECPSGWEKVSLEGSKSHFALARHLSDLTAEAYPDCACTTFFCRYKLLPGLQGTSTRPHAHAPSNCSVQVLHIMPSTSGASKSGLQTLLPSSRPRKVQTREEAPISYLRYPTQGIRTSLTKTLSRPAPHAFTGVSTARYSTKLPLEARKSALQPTPGTCANVTKSRPDSPIPAQGWAIKRVACCHIAYTDLTEMNELYAKSC